MFSKLRWNFSIYDIGETWISQNIDNQLSKYYRKWLQIPVSGNITHLCLPKNNLGVDIKAGKQLYRECKISTRRILKCSINSEARQLYELTTYKNVLADNIVNDVCDDPTTPKVQVKNYASNRQENSINKICGITSWV